MTGQTLAIAILRELDVIAGVDVPDQADVAFVLGKANRLLDLWNAEWGMAYCNVLSTFTLTPALNPHTIGPSGATWTLARPVSIEWATLVQGTSRTPLVVHRDSWRAGLIDPATTGSPTDLDYEPTSPNGSVYFYPVPDAADSVEVLARSPLAALTLTGSFTLPPGYEQALVLSGAEECADHFHAAITARMANSARRARAVIQAANATTPRLETRDDGMPGGSSGGRSNIYTGQAVSR